MTVGTVKEPSQAKTNPEIEAAKLYIKSQDPRVVELGLKHFKGIVKKGEGLEEAAAVASQFLIFDGSISQAIFYQEPVQCAALKLLKHLTDRGHGKGADVAANLVEWSQTIPKQLRASSCCQL